ncbi:DNA-binding protein [Clostridium sp. AF19-22AC]|nr:MULTISPECIES: DNA-binding protein [Clostridia]RHR27670.1 DNA-binding protein [Clostridium sp. AF19-22AC]
MITKVMNVNEILEQALLYDFYGELLTDHQKDIYEQFVLEDLSLSEIAQDAGISRQGVHDLVKRCQKILEGYEVRLHLVEKFLSIKEKVHKINEVLDSYEKQGMEPEKMAERIRKISDTIIEEL